MAQNASSVLPVAELHGVVCGFAAGNPTEFSLSDFVQLLGTDALSDEQAVNEFVGAVLDELFAPDMDFVPLVPDDTEVLSVRLTGIAQWTAGFLSGFGASFSRLGETMAAAGEARATRDALPLEVQEILQDFASISGLDEDVEGDETDEVSFMEIFEYVRVAAVLTLSAMPDREQEHD
jgi:hypothetical protein